MANLPIFQFRIETSKGRFYATADAESVEQAEQMARNVFARANASVKKHRGDEEVFSIEKVTLLKRSSGTPDQTISVFSSGETYVARAFFYALGLGDQYEKERTLQEAQQVVYMTQERARTKGDGAK